MKRAATAKPHPAKPSETVAVIELGTTSIRMAIAQTDRAQRLAPLESLQQAVSLGKDTFTRGAIERETTEACVNALRRFRRRLAEYGVSEGRLTAVATSAVREAANRDAFLDRIYIATGIDVRVIDEAETSRLTYLAVQPRLQSEAGFRKADAVVVEVGGGSTDLLVFRHGRVVQSHLYRLGSLRLSQEIEQDRIPLAQRLRVMESLIDRTVRQMVAVIPAGAVQVLALGGDARFACSRLRRGRTPEAMTPLSTAKLAALADEILGLSTDEVVKRHHLSYPDAETLGPALLMYVRLAQALGRKNLFVCDANLRDGALLEMAAHGAWTEEFASQVLSSSWEIATRYDAEEQHAEQVARLAVQLFDALRHEHNLSPRYRLILHVASLLHDIGMFVSNRSHHKHSMYLIANSDIFGLGGRERVLTALVARYHRRALPSVTHPEYAALDRPDRVAVAKLAAILRVADALSRSRAAKRRFDLALQSDAFVISAHTSGDLTLEQHALRDKGDMFERVYGRKVVLRATVES